jgi:hypothetical protein
VPAVSAAAAAATTTSMTRQAASRPFLLFRFALREGDFVLARLIARALWRGRRRGHERCRGRG